ncbi:sulfurtransferase [Romboutsia maritimum]|uniref:thiosulfate sulfurtransferase n=1 Tax=Romboutsia maritimum TaxID=2020948 RepID=A0A371IT71_9FIRM|nr:rhodanese-like domain-containing protein [Romboutsia maritimum]RDY23671.1 sulfurtransferase [Romboutsia maritimum]
MKIINKKISVILSMIMVSSIFAGCSMNDKNTNSAKNATKSEQTLDSTTKDDYTSDNTEYFTSISWLEKNIKDNKKLVIIDGRSEDDYKKSHIPGAKNVAWQSLAKMQGKAGDKDWGTLLDKQGLTKVLKEVGINENSEVIVYANKNGWGEDGRIVWCLQNAGIKARMLNGGFDLWSSENKETTKDNNEVVKGNIEIEKINNEMNITTDDLKKEISEVKIIDTREKDEYDGATKFGEKRGGHIPNSINIPFNMLYNGDGTIKSTKEIELMMKENNIEKTDKIVTYCTAGIRSAHMALILKDAGFKNIRNYDSSYYEWAADDANEVSK